MTIETKATHPLRSGGLVLLSRQVKGCLLRWYELLFFRLELTRPLWAADARSSWAWLLGAVLADVSVQLGTGIWGWPSLLFSALTLLMYSWVRPTLRFAVASLLLVQSMGSLLVLRGLEALGVQDIFVGGGTWLWQFWCIAALLGLLAKYLRTPKVLLASPN